MLSLVKRHLETGKREKLIAFCGNRAMKLLELNFEVKKFRTAAPCQKSPAKILDGSRVNTGGRALSASRTLQMSPPVSPLPSRWYAIVRNAT